MIGNQLEPIRLARLLLASLLTGLIMNVGEAILHGSILADATRSAYTALGRGVPVDPMNLLVLVVVTLVQAVVMMWLYTVLRPHFSSRVKTAMCAGLSGWLLAAVYAAVYLSSGFPGLLPGQLVWVPVAWQLIEYPLAVLAGASIYGK